MTASINQSTSTHSPTSLPAHIHHSQNVVWENWGRTARCEPQFSFHPKTLDDLVQIVNFARQRGLTVRAAASGHSWSSLIPTDGVLVHVHALNKVYMDLFDETHPRVVIESGATVKEVNDVLEAHGYALPLNVVLESVRFGGLIATGSHGSGWNNATLSDLVHAIELVTASGELRKFEAGADSPEVMSAVRVNLGMFGLMYRITMNVQKSWVVHAHDEHVPILQVFENLKESVMAHDNHDLFWWPFVDKFWVKTWTRTEGPITAKPRRSTWDAVSATIGSRIHNGLIQLSETFPTLTPRLSRTTFGLTPSIGDKTVDVVEAIHYRRAIEFARMGCVEVAFKVDDNFDNAKWAMRQVFERVNDYARRGEFPMNVVMNVRFIHNSQGLLSPAYGEGHTCYIEILSRVKRADWYRFSGEVALDWLTLPGARPHWAKEFQHIPGITQFIQDQFGGNIRRFNEIKSQLHVDPDHMFINPALKEIFNP